MTRAAHMLLFLSAKYPRQLKLSILFWQGGDYLLQHDINLAIFCYISQWQGLAIPHFLFIFHIPFAKYLLPR